MTSAGDLLSGISVVSVAINVPGPAAAARLTTLGAHVVTVLPPSGDPMEAAAPGYFAELHQAQDIVRLNLKERADRDQLAALLDDADLLITSSRPSALRRLHLDFTSVHAHHPRLCLIDIVGYPGAGAEVAGHDLTYQASAGLIRGMRMPTTLTVDLAGAERAAGEACAALLARAATGAGVRREVAMSDLAVALARPIVHGLTEPGGPLGGGLPTYGLYATANGVIAIAALEPHFADRLLAELDLVAPIRREDLEAAFRGRTSVQWQQWAAARDIPITALTDSGEPSGTR
ncbi:MAG: CoA transferase [Nostocoides sp.]